jgi:DNA-3-methyladenine glycosylase
MRALRQAKGKAHTDRELTSGPARLTQALAIDGAFDGTDLVLGTSMWLEAGEYVAEKVVECGPRIGIDYAAEEDRLAPWRFWMGDSPYVSG